MVQGGGRSDEGRESLSRRSDAGEEGCAGLWAVLRLALGMRHPSGLLLPGASCLHQAYNPICIVSTNSSAKLYWRF